MKLQWNAIIHHLQQIMFSYHVFDMPIIMTRSMITKFNGTTSVWVELILQNYLSYSQKKNIPKYPNSTLRKTLISGPLRRVKEEEVSINMWQDKFLCVKICQVVCPNKLQNFSKYKILFFTLKKCKVLLSSICWYIFGTADNEEYFRNFPCEIL